MQNLLCFTRPGVFARLVGTLLFLLIVLSMSLATSIAFGFSSIVHADSGQPDFSLQPVRYDPSEPLTKSYFIFDGKAGIVEKSSVRVTNSGTAKGSVSLYPVDATTGQTSGAVYLNQNDPRKDVGAWITLGTQQLTLNAGQSQIVPFQVTIPNAVRPGQHLGGIVAENLTQSNSSQSNSAIQINVKNLTIIAVQVNLPGTTVEQMAASGIKAGGQNGYQQLLIGLSNTGTDMLKPSGTLQIADAQGKVIKNFSLSLDTFLPQTAINYPVTITGQGLAPGNYQAMLNLTYGHNHSLHYVTKFTITQQQVTQVFGNNASKTQAPPGFGNNGFADMPLWQLLLVAGGALALLWVLGNMVYKRFAVAKAKPVVHSSQFKRPF